MDLEAKAGEAAGLLSLLANPHRLLILCNLMKHGEMQVGLLAETIGLSQSALSQHLARLRADGLVATRRDAQAIYYRIVDKRVAKLLKALETVICKDFN
jgi:DNA-binding transcriptional ArsR family regulator